MVLGNRLLKKTLEPMTDAATGGCRKYCYDDQPKERLKMEGGGHGE
jgi:hypothetical protein